MSVSRARVQIVGPLVRYAEGFDAELARLGYRRSSAAGQLRLMAQLSWWMARRRLDVSALTQVVVDEFFDERRAAGCDDYVTARALAPLMAFLRSLGVAPLCARPIVLSPAEELLDRYRRYLTAERGLRPGTAQRYVGLVRPFVVQRAAGDDGLAHLKAGEVTAFVVDQCRQPRRGSVKLMVTALRSLLRFLHVDGAVADPLASVVPSVAGWKLAGLPRALDGDQVRDLLASCDSGTVVGLRDIAILTLLVRLGLRVGEVASLSLDAIDWRRGEITVCGKGDRRERLPLPTDVGQATVAYLQNARPRAGDGRTVFVGAKAPGRALTSGAVTQVVVRAARRAGLGAVTGHRLRHTAASDMLRAGASLREIGQVLRHRDTLTTAIYAKVDIGALRTVARVWPGAGA